MYQNGPKIGKMWPNFLGLSHMLKITLAMFKNFLFGYFQDPVFRVNKAKFLLNIWESQKKFGI